MRNNAIQMLDVQKIWLTDNAVWLETADGRRACEYFADYLPLRNATAQERANFTRSPYGLHWEKLDEDLSYEGFFTH